MGVAEDLGSLAALYQAIGDNELAQKTHLLAISIYEKVGFLPGKIDALINLGILARGGRDFVEAEHWMVDAVQLAKKISSPRLLYEACFNLGDVYLADGKPREAVEAYTDAVATIEAIRAHLLTEDEALGYFDTPHLEAYDRAIRLQVRALHNPRQALLLAEQAKAREFLRRLRLSQILHTHETPNELLDQETQLLTHLQQSAQALTSPDQDHFAVLHDYHAAEERLQALWSQIELYDQEYVSLRRGEPASWEAIQQCLHLS